MIETPVGFFATARVQFFPLSTVKLPFLNSGFLIPWLAMLPRACGSEAADRFFVCSETLSIYRESDPRFLMTVGRSVESEIFLPRICHLPYLGAFGNFWNPDFWPIWGTNFCLE